MSSKHEDKKQKAYSKTKPNQAQQVTRATWKQKPTGIPQDQQNSKHEDMKQTYQQKKINGRLLKFTKQINRRQHKHKRGKNHQKQKASQATKLKNI